LLSDPVKVTFWFAATISLKSCDRYPPSSVEA